MGRSDVSKEDRFWRLAGNSWLDQSTYRICNWVMPFGKYAGKKVADVPVAYLCETVSEMGNSFVVLGIKKMLEDDNVFRLLLSHCDESGQLARGLTIRKMLESELGDESEWPAVASEIDPAHFADNPFGPFP